MKRNVIHAICVILQSYSQHIKTDTLGHICSDEGDSLNYISPTCPWPRDIVWMRMPVNPMSSPNFMRAFMGSAPGDRTKMRGAQQLESANDPARSKVGGSINVCPIFSTMKSCTAGTILSGRSVRRMTILSRSAAMSQGAG